MTTPLTEADVRRIVREEIANESRRSMARLRAMSGLPLQGDQTARRIADELRHYAPLELDNPPFELDHPLEDGSAEHSDRGASSFQSISDGVPDALREHQFIGDGHCAQLVSPTDVHESSPLVGEFSAPTVGEQSVAGVEEAPATAPAEGGDR